MNFKPSFHHRSPLSIAATSALAAFIAVGLLSGVASLFQRDGKPLEHMADAERACAQYSYVSERESCMREWLATARAAHVATK